MSLCKPRNSEIRDQKLDDIDGPTDGPTDRRTDIASYRVACTRLKRQQLLDITRHTPLVELISTQNIKMAILFGDSKKSY